MYIPQSFIDSFVFPNKNSEIKRFDHVTASISKTITIKKEIPRCGGKRHGGCVCARTGHAYRVPGGWEFLFSFNYLPFFSFFLNSIV
jgi:hypothetical protein